MPLTGPEAQEAATRLWATVQTTGWNVLARHNVMLPSLPLIITSATLALDGREVEFATARADPFLGGTRDEGSADLLLFVEGSLVHAHADYEPSSWFVKAHRLSDLETVEYAASESVLNGHTQVATWPADATATLRLRSGTEWTIPYETGRTYAGEDQSAFLQTLARISRSLA